MNIVTEVINEKLVIHCPKNFRADTAITVLVNGTQGADENAGVVLDFKQTEQFQAIDLCRCIGSLGKVLQLKKKSFHAINASTQIATEIRANGLDSTIKISLASILNIKEPKKLGFNVEFINPFIGSTITTLKTQCNVEPTCNEAPFLKGTRTLPAADIAGIIALSSKVFNGSVSICFPKDTFLGIMKGMLGETFTTITPELEDGAGELLNIIYGQSKIFLNEKGFGLEKAIPNVVRANDLSIRQFGKMPVIVLMFATNCGPFFIEIALDA